MEFLEFLARLENVNQEIISLLDPDIAMEWGEKGLKHLLREQKTWIHLVPHEKQNEITPITIPSPPPKQKLIELERIFDDRPVADGVVEDICSTLDFTFTDESESSSQNKIQPKTNIRNNKKRALESEKSFENPKIGFARVGFGSK